MSTDIFDISPLWGIPVGPHKDLYSYILMLCLSIPGSYSIPLQTVCPEQDGTQPFETDQCKSLKLMRATKRSKDPAEDNTSDRSNSEMSNLILHRKSVRKGEMLLF